MATSINGMISTSATRGYHIDHFTLTNYDPSLLELTVVMLTYL